MRPHLPGHDSHVRALLPKCVADALPGVPLNPTRWHPVLFALLDRYNWAHGCRAKNVSYKTMAERRTFLYSFFRQLRKDPEKSYRIDPRSLAHRHIEHMVSRWLQQGLSAGAFRNYLSHLRVFSHWIGKPGLVLPAERYVQPEQIELVRRTTVATEDRSWTARDVDVAERLTGVDADDTYVGAQLRMCHAFGLRVKESISLRPHSSVVERRLITTDGREVLATHLEVRRGTKGGRLRYVAVDSPVKVQALECAKKVAQRDTDSLADPRLSLQQAYSRFYYVLRRAGLTLKHFGVTAHGLRHQYANDKYQSLTGVPSPVRGGDGKADLPARLAVAKDLGHSRPQITSAYLGGRVRLSRRTASADDEVSNDTR